MRPALSIVGHTVGADQLILAHPGLVPHEKGRLTHAHVWEAVDFYTAFIYISLLSNQTEETTLEVEHSFVHYTATRNVEIQHYHTDIGIFANKLFQDNVAKPIKQLTLCGISAHHQIGIMDRAIKSHTLTTGTLPLHAQCYWPEYHHNVLATGAQSYPESTELTVNLDGDTPKIDVSDLVSATLHLCNCHTWECPCYLLDIASRPILKELLNGNLWYVLASMLVGQLTTPEMLLWF